MYCMLSVQTQGTDTPESRDQLQETVVYDAHQAVPRPFHHVHLNCTVLYCTVLYCNVLNCTVLYFTGLYCNRPFCTELYRPDTCLFMEWRRRSCQKQGDFQEVGILFSPHSQHCTLYIAHWTLHTSHCTVHIAHQSYHWGFFFGHNSATVQWKFLRKESDFCDVTLVCKEDKRI